MGFKVTLNGEIVCDSAEEAVAISRLMQNGRAPQPPQTNPRGRGRPRKNGPTSQEMRAKLGIPATLQLLRAIDHSKGGATADDIMLALGLTNGRAIGGAVVRAASVVTKLGLEPKRVFKSRGKPGSKVWHKGPDIENAVKRLEAALEGGDL